MGCGRIAKKHAEVLKHLTPVAELIAVCDVDLNKAKAIGERYNTPYYSDIHALLAKETVDVVNILTPSGLHAKNTLEVAAYQKHVVVEKPMALTLDSADAMIKACDQYGVKLFVVKQNRYNPAVQMLKKALDDGRFGKLVMGTTRVRWCRDQSYYDQDSWRGTWSMDGGVFANQASHHIDLLEWLLGDVVSVYAKSATQLVNIETEDTGVAILKFKNGALGIIEATTATRPKDLEGSISILGEKGTVEISGFSANKIKTWAFADFSEEDANVFEKYSQDPPTVYGFGHYPYLQNVIETIQGKAPALVHGLEGRKSLEMILAIYESIETNKEITLKFSPSKCKLGQD